MALLACAAGAVEAQAAADAPASAAALRSGAWRRAGSGHEAEVVLANRTVTVLRGTFYGVPAEGRARRAEMALRELAAQDGEGKVTVRAEPLGHALLVDGQLALILIAEDADRVSGQTLAQASSCRALRPATCLERDARGPSASSACCARARSACWRRWGSWP